MIGDLVLLGSIDQDRLVSIRKVFLLVSLALSHYKPLHDSERTDLKWFDDDWLLMVSIILSLRSRDDYVNKFMIKNQHVLSHSNVFSMELHELEILLKPFGLKFKSACIHELARDWEDLSKQSWRDLHLCKGVGPKSRDVFYNLKLGKNNVAVDTHTYQAYNKINYRRKLSLNAIRRLLNDESLFYHRFRAWCHIILVRFNKRGFWCNDGHCAHCCKLKEAFGLSKRKDKVFSL